MLVTQTILASSNDTIILTGKVTENRIPFPAAIIKLKGTSIETTTDIHGDFILKIPPTIKVSQITLIASYIGMIPKEVTVRNVKRKIHIKLKPEMVIIE